MTEIALAKSFEERMFEQMKSQMGDLLTPTELKKILDDAIEKAFFSKRRKSEDYRSVEIEPLFVELIREEIKPLILAGVQQWLNENQDQVGAILKETIGDNAAEFMAKAFSNLLSDPMQSFAWQLRDKLAASNVVI